MNKFLMIIPPNVPYDTLMGSDKQFASKLRQEVPIGAVSIVSYIKQFFPKWEYRIIDLNIIYADLNRREEFYNNSERSLNKIFAEFINEKDENVLIGISSLFDATFTYLDIISRVCRRICNKAFIFAGGGVPTNLYREVFDNAIEIEAINFGEGELPILKYMQADDKKFFLLKNNAWITRDKVNNDFIPQYDFIENLDEIPTLDYSYIEFEKYSPHIHSQTQKKIIAAPLMFSRGCPFNCCFCASHSVHGKRVRYNTLPRIINDIGAMKDKYSINTLTVWDDNFFVDKERAFALLDACESMNITMEFVNSFPVYRMDEEMIIRLKRAGVEVVSLAIESGCQRVLNEVMHKGHVKLEMVKKAIELLRQHELYIKAVFVIGIPGEKREEIQETLHFIKTAGLNWVDIFVASPIAGSELYQICKDGNYLDNSKTELHDFFTGCISTEEFTSEEISNYQLETVIYCDYVNNWDMKHGFFERALMNFRYVMKSNPDNPFAFFYASKCAEKLKLKEADELLMTARKILSESNKWNDLANKFQIEM